LDKKYDVSKKNSLLYKRGLAGLLTTLGTDTAVKKQQKSKEN